MTTKSIDRLGLRAERDRLGATWIDPRPWKQRAPAMGKRSHPRVSPELGKAKVPRQHYLRLIGSTNSRDVGRALERACGG